MAAKKGPAPAPLDPKVAKRLLDLLSSDNDFRRLFKKDAHAALLKAGYRPPPGTEPAQAAALSGADCMQLEATDRIAPKDRMKRDRAKLETAMSLPMRFIPPLGMKAD